MGFIHRSDIVPDPKAIAWKWPRESFSHPADPT